MGNSWWKIVDNTISERSEDRENCDSMEWSENWEMMKMGVIWKIGLGS